MGKNSVIADVGRRLQAAGFNGLYNNDGPCACALDDLAPCGECHVKQGAEEWINGCKAGYKHTDPRSKIGDFVVSADKESPTPEEFDSAFSQC